MARRNEPSVSRATVYRTLPLLVECGVLKEMDFGKEYKFYDPNFAEHPHHNHLICVDCDRIVEFEDRNIETMEDCITKRLGFSPANKMIRIEAKCDKLKTSGVCKNKEKCV
jgi:Fur family ferric uptake transcriptional regulator